LLRTVVQQVAQQIEKNEVWALVTRTACDRQTEISVLKSARNAEVAIIENAVVKETAEATAAAVGTD